MTPAPIATATFNGAELHPALAALLAAALPILYAVVIGLASYRIWRLIGHDTITEPWLWGPLRRNPHPVAQWFDSLITCAWCLGFWINAGISVALWLWVPGMITTWWAAALTALAGSAITGLTARRAGEA